MIKAVLSALVLLCPYAVNAAETEAKSENEKTLYSIGYMLSDQLYVFDLKKEDIPFVEKGFSDALNKRKASVDAEKYVEKISEFAQLRWEARLKKVKAESEAFLKKAASEKNAVALSSGVIYTEIKAGAGDSPLSTDTVKVHYTGTLPDGKVFDSSVARGSPASFMLAHVIPCWTTGVAKMKTGGKARLVCPSDTAYGDEGKPPVIPGGSALVFEVELLDIIKAEKK